MANGLISAARYGGPAEAIVEDPGIAPVQTAQADQSIVDDSTPSYEPTSTPYVPTVASVAPQSRDLDEENNWMADLEKYANQRYPGDENQAMRDKFIEMTARKTRNNIAMQRSANQQILIHDKNSLNQILMDEKQFQGRGPRNDYEATQINNAWPAMRSLAEDHDKSVTKYIDGMFDQNTKMNVPPTSDRKDRFDQAMGLINRAMRLDPSVDRYEVIRKLGAALPNMDLPKDWTKQVHEGLQGLMKQRQVDIHMGQYLTWAEPLLSKAHILSTDIDRRIQFEGALAHDLKLTQSTSKDPEAPLTPEDVFRVTQNLLIKESTGKWMGTAYEFEVPKGYMTPDRIAKFKKATGFDPTPQNIYDLWSMHKARVQAGQEKPEISSETGQPYSDPYYVQQLAPGVKK
jgi:hypothetical protein